MPAVRTFKRLRDVPGSSGEGHFPELRFHLLPVEPAQVSTTFGRRTLRILGRELGESRWQRGALRLCAFYERLIYFLDGTLLRAENVSSLHKVGCFQL